MTTIRDQASLSGLRLVLSALMVVGGMITAASWCAKVEVNRATTAPVASLVLEITLTQSAIPGQASADTTRIQVGTYQTRSVQSCITPGSTPSATSGPSVTPTGCSSCVPPGASLSLPGCPVAVALSGHQALSVNGMVFPFLGDPKAASYSSTVQVPRQPPGRGVYFRIHGRARPTNALQLARPQRGARRHRAGAWANGLHPD
jgi:hypothetical protein